LLQAKQPQRGLKTPLYFSKYLHFFIYISMRTFENFQEANRPGGPLADRSLEGFDWVLQQLNSQIKSVFDPKARQELQQLASSFHEQMNHILSKYRTQGVGYSQRYEPPTF